MEAVGGGRGGEGREKAQDLKKRTKDKK